MELLSRLRRAVRKLTFVLNLKKYINQSPWRFVSLLARARAPAAMITGRRRRRRALSFNDRPGLRACVDLDEPGRHITQARDDDDDDDDDDDQNVESEGCSTGTTSSPLVLRRTASCPSPSEEDSQVDEKAEKFIAWFREQLNYERQISLRLRYVRGHSFGEDSSSNSNDTNLSPLSSNFVVSPT